MSKSTKMNAGGNITTNSSRYSYNKYISGSGVGAQTVSNHTAKRKLSSICFQCKTNNTFTLTYSGNGQSSGTPPNSVSYKSGTLVTVSENVGGLVKTGNIIVGWNTQPDGNGITYDYNNPYFIITGNITLYAKWFALTQYTLTYDGNGESSGVPPNSAVYSEGSPPIPVSGNTGLLEKTNFTFLGWNTQPDGNGITYDNVNPFISLTGNITLYAKWGSSFTLIFDKNGEDVSGIGPSNIIVYSITTISIPDIGLLLRPGYIFSGWNTTSLGDGEMFMPASSFIIDENVTLYAIWEPT